MPNFKLANEDLENIKVDYVDTSFSTYVKSNVGRFLEHPVQFRFQSLQRCIIKRLQN